MPLHHTTAGHKVRSLTSTLLSDLLKVCSCLILGQDHFLFLHGFIHVQTDIQAMTH